MYPDQGSTKILVIDADPSWPDRIYNVLAGDGASLDQLTGRGSYFDIVQVSNLDAALARLPFHAADILLVGLDGPTHMGTAGIKLLHENYPALPIIALLAAGQDRMFTDVHVAGALDYLNSDCRRLDTWLRALRYGQEQGRLRQQLLEAESELERMSFTDPLTGQLNRRGIEQSLLRELHRCRQKGNEFLVLLVDMDNFNRINSSLDHGMGDLVLQNAAERIRSVVHDASAMGRAGDDQFLVLLPGLTVEEGMIIAERIRLAITRDRIEVGDKSLMMTASIGLTSVPPDTLAISEVLAHAHVALHRSKSLGKNRVCCAMPSHDGRGLPQPIFVSGELLQSLLYDGVLRVTSQPIVRLDNGEIVSREMLIRGPKGTLQQPVELFRYCFEKDILTPVDLHCLKKCVDAARRTDDGKVTHVNIMPSTLLETPTDELVELLSYAEGGCSFCLEICEQQLVNDPSHLVPAVRTLQNAQVQIAMDDVGFGKSCLEGLLMLRPEVLKIDKKLIIGLGEDRSMRLALKRLLRVTEVLETEVIAEGIECEDDLRVLQDYGVYYGQGFFFGGPEFIPDRGQVVLTRAPTSLNDSDPPPAAF